MGKPALLQAYAANALPAFARVTGPISKNNSAPHLYHQYAEGLRLSIVTVKKGEFSCMCMGIVAKSTKQSHPLHRGWSFLLLFPLCLCAYGSILSFPFDFSKMAVCSHTSASTGTRMLRMAYRGRRVHAKQAVKTQVPITITHWLPNLT
jgi:hypothetical protein